MEQKEPRLIELMEGLRSQRLNRRSVLRLAVGGVGLTATSALVAACGSEPDDEDDEESDPTEPSDSADSAGESDEATEDTGTAESTAADEATSASDEGEEAEGEPKPGGKLIEAVGTAPIGFDPHTSEAFSSMMFYEQVYDRMFEFATDLEVIPCLAESFEVVDETTYSFAIRQGVKFHNGREMTADDIKYSYDRIINPDTASPLRSFFSTVESVEVTDDYTVVFNLTEPFAPMIGYMAEPSAAIVAKEVVEENGDLKRVAVGTGPFVLENYETDQAGHFTKFEDHWREGIPRVDELELRIMPDERSRMAALQADEISMARVYEPQNADTLEEDGFQIYTGLCASRTLTVINCAKEPFNDPNVRLALSYAIDREAFRETALFETGAVTGVIPVVDEVWALPVSEYASFTPDIDKAKQLLSEAGYPDGFEATITVSTEYSFDVTNSQILQGQMEQIGVKLDIQQLEWGNLLNVWTDTQDFELLNIILTHDPDPDGYTYGDFFSASPTNYCGLADPALDELLIEGRTTPDMEARKEIYDEIQRKLADELVPYLTYYSYNQYLPAQKYVKGFEPIPSLSRVYLREAWLDQ